MKESYIIINNEKIYLRIYTKENNKNIVFSIKNGYIYVSKPRYISCEKIKKLLLKNKDEVYSNYKKVRHKLDNLDYILYNGKKKQLKIISIEKGCLEKVEIVGDYIYVFTNNLDNVKRLLINFYKYNLDSIIKIRLNYYLNQITKDGFNVYFNKVKTKFLRSRWGSCSYTNMNLNFNIKMMMLPDEVIDYILIHEISHLIEPNHSKKFWNLVERYCSSYKSYNKYLKGNYDLFLYLD